MRQGRFRAWLAAILVLAAALRAVYPAADPPWRSTVGVVWHDEGAWVHNARNKALFGAWRQDEWNPVYIAPVFTAFEYGSFALFGVGVRQARLVSEAAGVLSVLLLALGVRRMRGDLPGVFAGALLAVNYVYVMYDRAAIMEALMAAFIVASWYCAARAEREPRWGAAAGAMAALAFFTKAAAAFFAGALGLIAAVRLIEDRRNRSAIWTLGGLALSFGLAAAFFVLPHRADYWFYNWQMSVTRKPVYTLAALATRAIWFPILHDTFSRMWPALALGVFGAWGLAARWRAASDGERLLVLWIAAGSLELLVHDVSNERRFVFLIPALVAVTSTVLADGALLTTEAARVDRARVALLAPLIAYSAYVVAGPLARLPFLDQVHEHVLRWAVRLAAALAIAAAGGLIVWWARARALFSRRLWTPRAAVALVAAGVAWNGVEYAGWARGRTYRNYDASLALGRALPPGTLVQGKLANGLSLENRIRPLFVGHEFGNYRDRKQRDDVRYILTYTAPYLAYEGSQILDVLQSYPGWRVIMTFDVAESPGGHDTAGLIEKRARH